MTDKWLKMHISNETMGAIFIIVLVSLFILANFTAGFIFPLYLLAMALSFFIAILSPRSGIYATIFLTIIFERFFTLQPIILGKIEYKLYPIDIILAGIFIGTIFELLSQKITMGSDTPEFIDEGGQKKPHSFELKKCDLYLIGFMILVSIYFLGSVLVFRSDFALAFSSFKNYAFYSLLFFMVAILINREKYAKRIFKFFFAGALFLIFFILYGLTVRHGLWSDYTPLSTEGIRTLAFTHAFYLGIALLALLAYLAGRKKDLGFFHTALILIWSVGIAGSMMRHLWAGIAFSVLVLAFLVPPEQRVRFGKIVLTCGSALFIFFVLTFYLSTMFPNSGFSSATTFTQSIMGKRIGSVFHAASDESFSWRNLVWAEGFKEYAKSPVLGLGLGKRMYVESADYKAFVEVRNIHNSLLVLLFQFGVIPFLLFLGFLYGNLTGILKKTDRTWIDAALIAALAYYLISFLFQPYLETNLLGIFFWVILGLISARTNAIPQAKFLKKIHESSRNK